MSGEPMQNSKYYVLTIKDYLPQPEQEAIESEFILYIKHMWDKHKMSCIFIPTGANPIEENDVPVGERIAAQIKNNKVFAMEIPKTPEETKRIIRGAKFAMCTRMHSAIFAVTEFIPFIAIAYEHKSIGLLESLSLSKWHIRMTQVTCSELYSMTKKLLNKQTYANFIKTLMEQQTIITNLRQELKHEIVE